MLNDKELLEKLRLLESKYEATGQDLGSYLSGLYETDYLNYWDYIQLDTLLNIQIKRTTLPDEEIFIMYHQITELYFKLILLELKQMANSDGLDLAFFEARIGRITRYFEILIQSFNVMMDGMEPQQFMKFRLALLPASGFQSVQYRLIELASTKTDQLLDADSKSFASRFSLTEKVEKLYWRKGSTELATGKKTLTLVRFEEKYDKLLLDFALEFENKNLLKKIGDLDWKLEENQALKLTLRRLDEKANIEWPLAHFYSAMRYLNTQTAPVNATGGTNWQRHLPPKFQKTIFFPDVWNDNEIENWGRTAFEKATVKPF